MTPTRDPLALTPAELASEEERSFELEEEAARHDLRRRSALATSPRARRHAHLRETGLLSAPGLAHARRTRRRLAIRSGATTGEGGLCVVLRRGAELVRLPFA